MRVYCEHGEMLESCDECYRCPSCKWNGDVVARQCHDCEVASEAALSILAEGIKRTFTPHG